MARPSVAMFEPSTTTWRCITGASQPPGTVNPVSPLTSAAAWRSGDQVARRLRRRDPGGAVGLRRRHPHQPVRGLRRLRAPARPARGLHPPGERRQPRQQRLGPARAQRARRRWASPRRSRPRRATSAASSTAARSWDCWPAPSGPRWSRRSSALRRPLPPGLPHQQRRQRRRRRPPARGRRGDGAVRPGGRVEQGRGPQARAPLLRAGLRAARGRAGRVRVPRRPRHQPQAGPRDGHDHDQGRATPTSALAELEQVLGLPLRDEAVGSAGPAKVSSSSSCCSWSWILAEPVAGLPDSTRATHRSE